MPYGRIARLGMPGARARTVVAMARAVADGKLVLMPNADIEATLEQLRALPGVGEWTAQYIAMRALAWPDAFPHTDLVVKKALGRNRCAQGARCRRSLAALACLRGHAPVELTDKGMNMRYYDAFQSPQGQMLLVATEEGVSGVYFAGQKYFPEKDKRMEARRRSTRA